MNEGTTPMRRISTTLIGLAALGASVTTPATAAGTPAIVSGPGSTNSTYTTPVAVVQAGDALLYVNADIAPHDVVARTMGPNTAPHCSEDGNPFVTGIQRRFPIGECPIFWTELITATMTTPVRGLENVAPLTTYEFYCSIHASMKGTLVSV